MYFKFRHWVPRSARRKSARLRVTLRAQLGLLKHKKIYSKHHLFGDSFVAFDVCNGLTNQRLALVNGILIGHLLVRACPSRARGVCLSSAS